MNDRKCAIAVIGVGQRGCTYVEMIKKHPQAELAAICDISPERLDAFAEELDCRDVPQFHSVDELLAGCEFDAAVITTPDFVHRECAVKCFQADKHVMLEKPMAPNAEDCRVIIEESRKHDRILQMGFVLRCLPLYKEVKRVVDSGEIGQLLSMNFAENIGVMHGASYMRRWHRKSINTGGFLLAKCSHDLDLMNQLAGSYPSKIASFGGLNFFTSDKLKQNHCSRCDDASCRFRFKGEMVKMTPRDKEYPSERSFDLCVYTEDKDVVDNQQVMLEYANGVRASFALNLFAPVASRRWELVGTEGYISADTAQKKITVSSSTGKEQWSKICKAENGSFHDGSDWLFLDEFVDCVRSGREPEADLEAGFATAVIGIAAEKSRLEGKIIDVSPAEYKLS